MESTRTLPNKRALFRSLFSGHDAVYGTYDPRTGKSWQVKSPVTDEVIADHLQGRRPFGVYLLTADSTKAAVADFDTHDAWPAVEFTRRAQHYNISAYIERSKSKGYHVWTFLERPVPASKVRLVFTQILTEIEAQSTEIFPKQDRLTGSSYGNFINCPLFGRLVPQGRTVFLGLKNGLKPYPDQWEFLESIKRVTETSLDNVIEINALSSHSRKPGYTEDERMRSRYHGLMPKARRMLREGVTDMQRVSCFRLAVALRNAGLPYDVAVGALEVWAQKNRPEHGKRVITAEEIREQTSWAYRKNYAG